MDSESIGRIVKVNRRTLPAVVTVRWLASGVRADYAEERLHVLCPTCAGQDRDFGDEQLARLRAECEECK
jgi:hypothetical protein